MPPICRCKYTTFIGVEIDLIALENISDRTDGSQVFKIDVFPITEIRLLQ